MTFKDFELLCFEEVIYIIFVPYLDGEINMKVPIARPLFVASATRATTAAIDEESLFVNVETSAFQATPTLTYERLDED